MKSVLHRWSRWAAMLSLAAGAFASHAETQVSIGISVPGVSIGINTPQYPRFVRVPSYPVYYAPEQDANLFFYDGLYWAYQRDDWYASSWYDGPWYAVSPQRVPVYVLRVPVRYYRDPPNHFRGWQRDAPPRWGEYWGNDWQQQRSGWDRWNRSAMPAPAPLPSYQQQYSGERYPQAAQQRDLQGRNYPYQPRDAVAREHFQHQALSRQGGSGRGNSLGNGKGKGKDKDKDKDKGKGRDKDDDRGKRPRN